MSKSALREVELAEISPSTLRDEDDAALKQLVARAHEWWANPDINRETVLNAYIFIVAEFKRRERAIDPKPDPTTELNRALLALLERDDPQGLLPLFRESVRLTEDAFADFVYVPDFVCVTGSTLYHEAGHEPNDLDVVVRRSDVWSDLEEALAKHLGPEVSCIWEPRGPNWDFVPIYDLVLRVRRDQLTEAETPDARPTYDLPRVAALLEHAPREIVLVERYAVIGGDVPTIWIAGPDPDALVDLKLQRQALAATSRVPEFKRGKEGPADGVAYDLVLRRVPGTDVVQVREPEFKERMYTSDMAEIFHVRGVHWVPPRGDGGCPVTHPVLVRGAKVDGMDTRCYTPAASRELRRAGRFPFRGAVDKLMNKRSNLRAADPDNAGERCGQCQYFVVPTTCKVVEGPVAADRVCDWIQSRGIDAPTYEVSDEDWEAFGRGMIEKQPYQHLVRDVALTPEGPLVMIEDTAEPKPHRFSLTKKFHIGHTSFEHHWTQDEVNRLIEMGAALDEAAREGADDRELWEPWARGVVSRFVASRPADWPGLSRVEREAAWREAMEIELRKVELDGHAHAVSVWMREYGFLAAARVVDTLREQKVPTQVEQRRALEKAIGDWYMVTQPAGAKTFPWVLQEHIRGVIDPNTRRDAMTEIRRIRKLEGKEQRAAFEKVWRDLELAILDEPFEAIQRAAQKASDANRDVTKAIERRLKKKPPRFADFEKALDGDRVVTQGNAHSDLRFLHPSGDFLVGWTNATPSAVLQWLKTGTIRDVLRNEFTENVRREKGKGDNLIAFKKATQPLAWLTLVTRKRPEFWAPPGTVGATKETAGLFRLLAEGRMIYGAQKTDFHELFLFVDHPAKLKGISGRWGWQVIRPERELKKVALDQFWIGNRPGEGRPYIFTHDYDKEIAKGKREKVDVIWNHDAIAALEKAGYFKGDLADALEEWRDSPRGKRPAKEAVFVRPERKPRIELAKAQD